MSPLQSGAPWGVQFSLKVGRFDLQFTGAEGNVVGSLSSQSSVTFPGLQFLVPTIATPGQPSPSLSHPGSMSAGQPSNALPLQSASPTAPPNGLIFAVPVSPLGS